MGFIEILLLAIGLSMDAFAVAICAGLTMIKINRKKAIIIGFYFGGFQAIMPVIGYYVATIFADKIVAYDHYIAFVLLTIIGGKMIYECFTNKGCPDRECPDERCTDRTCPEGFIHGNDEYSVRPAVMLPLALATSIDALAVGVSFAFLQVDIIPAAAFIGVTTFFLSICGVVVGAVFGSGLRTKAQFIGGIVLVLIGVKILLEHTGVVSFPF